MGRTSTYRTLLLEEAALSTESMGPPESGRVRELVSHLGQGGIGLSDRSHRDLLVVTGEDAVPFLQGMVTNDLFVLAAEGRGLQTSVVNLQGRLVAEMCVLHLLDLLLIDLEGGVVDAGLLAHLKRHVIAERVRFELRSERSSRLTLWGEAAIAAVATLPGWGDVGELEPFCGMAGEMAGLDVIAQRSRVWSGPSLDLVVDAEEAHRLWRFLRERWTSIFVIDEKEAEALRVGSGIPRWGVELDATVIPLEAGLDDTISYTKGCYLGQEIIARLDTLGTPKQLLRTLAFCSDTLPVPGAPVLVGGKQVGAVRSAAWTPVAGRGIALAFLKRSDNALGTEVVVSGEDDTVARVCGLGDGAPRTQ